MGRNKEFDPDKAVDDALKVFWRKGYHDASLKDLIAGTGVNNYGLYSVFRSKHGLFLEAMRRYHRDVTGEMLKALADSEASGAGFQKFLKTAQQCLTPDGETLGCFVCNCMVEMAGRDEQVHNLIDRNRKSLKKGMMVYLNRFDKTKSKTSITESAETLVTGLYTMGLLIRSKSPKTAINSHMRSMCAAL